MDRAREFRFLSFGSAVMATEVRAAAARHGFSLDVNAAASTTVVVWDGSDLRALEGWFSQRLAHAIYFGVLPAIAGPHGQALAAACQDFLLWPRGEEELGVRLARLSQQAPAEPADARRRLIDDTFATIHLVGRSPNFVAAVDRARRFAATQATVLIEGASGTGKELVARAIHYWGARRGRAFVPINCGALPDSLVEDELFGHEPGAFTDARRARRGVVDQAHGGTLFLDEVEALSPKGQVALLRFLQDQEFRPLGSQQPRQGDVRVIAATNAPLATLVAGGRFREDLRYRLDVLSVALPALVERLDDLEPLCTRILHRLRSRYGGPPRTLAPGVIDRLKQHAWPGNVRELENVLHRAVVTSESPVLSLDGQRARDTAADNADVSYREARARVIAGFEREYLTWLMARAKGNVSRAARLIGKERRSLGKLLKKHGLGRASGE
jgi:DNA-binding NtrC family response regulator